MTGSITNSPTLNRYAYVNGNPISLNDPFGLSPLLNWLGHTALDILGTIPIAGIVFDGINAWWYFKEKDYFNAACSVVAALPGIGDFIAVSGKGSNIGCQLIKGFNLAEQATNMMQSAYGGATSLSNMIDAWGDGEEASGWDKLGLVVSGLSFRGSAKGFKNVEASSYCFIAGTLITTSDGFKPIEEIQAGDEVLSENELTGEVEVKKVTQTFVNETNELVHIHVNGEEIVATPSHPFYVDKLGWTLARSLRAGDVLVLSNGELVTVEFIQHEILENPIKVYNFEVEDFHTYFVGECGVLIHNACDDFDTWLSKGDSDNSVYFGKIGDDYKYTGITKQSKDARLQQHNYSPTSKSKSKHVSKNFDDLDIQTSGLTRNQARAIEQYYIEHGPNELNKINSISKKHRYYDKAMAWAEKYIIDNDLLRF